MTDDEKLALLTELEDDFWGTLQVLTHNDDWRVARAQEPLSVWEDSDITMVMLKSIERCQRIRAGLTQAAFKVTNRDNPVVYQKPSSGDEEF